MTSKWPTLSVVVPTRNHASLVTRAIDAIATQSWAPLEVLVIDDASTDETPAVLAGLAARHPAVRVLRNERNLGVAGAFNAGLALARGDFVYGGASDDWVLPGAFERAMSLASEHPGVGAVFGPMFALGRPPAIFRVRSWSRPLFAPPEVFIREYLEVEAPAFSLGGATFFRRAPFLELGGMRKELGAYCDTFAFRALGVTHGVCYVPEPLMVWDVQPGSFSRSSMRDPPAFLAVVSRVATAMRTPPLAGRFPPDHVDRWEREFRRSLIDDACRQVDAALARVASSRSLFDAAPAEALALSGIDALRGPVIPLLRQRLAARAAR